MSADHDQDGREMARGLEEGAERFLRGASSFMARVGCLVVGSIGLTGACRAIFGTTAAAFRGLPDSTGAGWCLLAAAVAFGTLAFASRRTDGPGGPRRPGPEDGSN